MYLHTTRRRFAGVERGSRVSQFVLNLRCERMCASEHAPCDPRRLLERRHSLVEIVERGVGVIAERRCVNPRSRRDASLYVPPELPPGTRPWEHEKKLPVHPARR